MSWYVVNYKPGEGDRACENLSNQGVVCFFPKVAVERLQAGRRVLRSEPLFKGYLFINLSQDDPNWSKLRSTRGVLKVLSFGGQATPLAEDVIEHIRDSISCVEDAGGLKPGTRIHFRSGPFKGLEALFECYDGEARAMVLIEFMQARKKVSVPLAYL